MPTFKFKQESKIFPSPTDALGIDGCDEDEEDKEDDSELLSRVHVGITMKSVEVVEIRLLSAVRFSEAAIDRKRKSSYVNERLCRRIGDEYARMLLAEFVTFRICTWGTSSESQISNDSRVSSRQHITEQLEG